MILKHRVALNGTQLDSLDNRILIQSVDEAAGKETITAVSLGGGNGQRVTGRRRDTLDVTVKFSINSRDMATRSTILDNINKWAYGGGTLTLNNRGSKSLTVEFVQAPGGGDQFKWTSEFSMVFRAYTVPYWQDTTATSKALTQDDAGSDTITMPGSTDTIGEATIQNKSGSTLNTVSLTVNGYTMAFTDLSMANNATLTIDHITAGGAYVKRAKIGSTSVLDKLTGADEFILTPGSNTISYEAGGDVIVTVSAKGRYL